MGKLSVRELQAADIPLLVNYWMGASPEYLKAMGVDLLKMPGAEEFSQRLASQLQLPVEKRVSYCLIWELDGDRVGHCNTNPTFFGNDAVMHLHLWDSRLRGSGLGQKFVKMCVVEFFKNLQLKKIISEPFSHNTAPHNTLKKVGFELVKEYITIPGSINFEQPVKRWELTAERFKSLGS